MTTTTDGTDDTLMEETESTGKGNNSTHNKAIPAGEATPPPLPLAPSMNPTLRNERVFQPQPLVDKRVLFISGLAVLTAFAAGFVAKWMLQLIGLITNICFYHHFSLAFSSPAGNHLGPWVILVPVGGALVVGLMARFGSHAIRGDGIPEVMEQVLVNRSRIPARITFLKPLSAAISIGTGGPFGAEGPIIATGGALGSLVGQLIRTTAVERKTLLAAGAAAGMTATFGCPIASVLIALEILVFEVKPRSLVPICLAAVTATGVRNQIISAGPIFAMPQVAIPTLPALALYALVGATIGLLSVGVTRLIYFLEDTFEHLPVHWMWWPAIGAVVVGVVGYFAPRTLGVGYENIDDILSGSLTLHFVLWLAVMKLISWSIALGSGTSGGTLSPMFTIGGAAGAAMAMALSIAFPNAGIDPRIAALVGMAAIFAGAFRTLLAFAIFAFETTHQPLTLLPLLSGCTTAYLVACFRMKNTINTEKIARRGVLAPAEYGADYLKLVAVADAMTEEVTCFATNETIEAARTAVTSGEPQYQHGGFPVVDEKGDAIGVVTPKDILNPLRKPEETLGEIVTKRLVTVNPDDTLRHAADMMVHEEVGRILVVNREAPTKVVGILSRTDILSAHRKRLLEAHEAEVHIDLFTARTRK